MLTKFNRFAIFPRMCSSCHRYIFLEKYRRAYPEVVLNEMEQLFIKEYADRGYQLRNKTSGSQGEGKTQIDDYRPQKGYRDGIQQGRKNMARELSSIAEKHLKIELRADKANNKVSQKQYGKFMDLLKEGNSE